ncbi:CRISPR-associated helicase Cas3' [Amaricoccus sp.]|uniref:CRISPR-associated helicase Cas3' n=1 Tax=Amaricoccus sp. TaxID=1872485 RepID=UPI001B6D3FEA|nr:CRISPR-associated helicase Cas3' [Amaricoccus sp.]MBP7003095.1 CRISPR-associated helicase Cas3' [Amaricoccus sp.]
MFFAHSLPSRDESDWQTLLAHLTEVSRRAAGLARDLGLPLAAALAGLAHDLGKYDPRFQDYIRGRGPSVDHSTAGGAILMEIAGRAGTAEARIAAEVLAYCILGHHAGLPDRINDTAACLDARVERFGNGLDPAWRTELALSLDGVAAELLAHAGGRDTWEFDLSVVVRMIFSCLVEADFLDTEAFYAAKGERTPDRSWPRLQERLPELRARFDAHVAGLGAGGDVNPVRRRILAHVRERADLVPGLFTLTVPTGGGKTLASLGFALDHAAAHGARRIIYAIPFTSIIDQTAAIFRDVLGKGVVLEHHSAIDEERNERREGKDKLRLAMENWAAPVVVTTNVQLFESLFAARPSRARKLCNIAGSVIVLDEAQALPKELLKPCLRMLDCLARRWGCSIVFCTATQPSVEQALEGEVTLDLRELAPDPDDLAATLRRARIVDGGEMDDAALVEALAGADQGFAIVNSRGHALELFREAKAAGLAGLVHLTTRQTAAHRQEILAEVRRRLRDGEPCRLVATSLIEAGVDVSFPRGWRAKAGLDQMIQAAGRVNREGKWRREDSLLTFFANPAYPTPPEVRSLIGDAERMWDAHADDPQSPAAVAAYFRQVYARLRLNKGLDRKKIVGAFTCGRSGTEFAFRSVAERFRLIESAMLPVAIPRGEAAGQVERLWAAEVSSGTLARALQRHVVLVPEPARRRLLDCGKAEFVAPKLRGDQFCVLKAEHLDLYHEDSGLWWEDAEYLGVEQVNI